MKYFSQFLEDKFIYEMIVNEKLNISKFVIEMGACDGLFFSNSRLFIEQGWEALLIEPNKTYYNKLLINNEKYKKVNTLNVAISNKTGKRYLLPKKSMDNFQLTDIDTGIECEAITFKEMLNRGNATNKEIGIISIDVEGLDTEVLIQCLNETKPQIIIIEGHSIEAREEQIRILIDDYYFASIFVFNTIWLRKDIAKTFISDKNKLG